MVIHVYNPSMGIMKQKDYEFEPSLSYIARSYLKPKPKNKKKNKNETQNKGKFNLNFFHPFMILIKQYSKELFCKLIKGILLANG